MDSYILLVEKILGVGDEIQCFVDIEGGDLCTGFGIIAWREIRRRFVAIFELNRAFIRQAIAGRVDGHPTRMCRRNQIEEITIDLHRFGVLHQNIPFECLEIRVHHLRVETGRRAHRWCEDSNRTCPFHWDRSERCVSESRWYIRMRISTWSFPNFWIELRRWISPRIFPTLPADIRIRLEKLDHSYSCELPSSWIQHGRSPTDWWHWSLLLVVSVLRSLVWFSSTSNRERQRRSDRSYFSFTHVGRQFGIVHLKLDQIVLGVQPETLNNPVDIVTGRGAFT